MTEGIPKPQVEVSCDHRIRLCTSKPEELRSDYLYKLLPNILNPGGIVDQILIHNCLVLLCSCL